MGAGHEKAAEALLEGGSPWLIKNYDGHTPMKHAVEEGYALMARLLELHFFRVDAKRRKRLDAQIKNSALTMGKLKAAASRAHAKRADRRKTLRTVIGNANSVASARRISRGPARVAPGEPLPR